MTHEALACALCGRMADPGDARHYGTAAARAEGWQIGHLRKGSTIIKEHVWICPECALAQGLRQRPWP